MQQPAIGDVLSGLLLKESLGDTSVLELLQITKAEVWQVSNAAAHQPSTWTALSFEVAADQAENRPIKR